MDDRSAVPCNGCAACCRRERIILTEDEQREFYIVVPTRKGDGPIEFMLAHKHNGDCHYLIKDETGGDKCSIWDRAPKACREFDCRKWFAGFSPMEQAVVTGGLDKLVALAAMERQ